MINISKKNLGKLNNKEIFEYSLKNSCGFEVKILNLGAIISKIIVSNKNKELVNVVLGYDFFEKYIDDVSYTGSIIGPTSGRIEKGKYSIDGINLVLGINDGENSNHGGFNGLNSRVFDVREIEYKEYRGIELEYSWPHLQENHYGNISFCIRYLINEKNELKLEMYANSDRNSYINLTNHSYFNLAGNLEINGDEQFLYINSDEVCELNSNLIPTGKLIGVENTCFDFRNSKKISDGIEKGHSQFDYTRAYDHAFVIKDKEKKVASIYSNYSGINLDIYTNQNVLVMYSGNYLDEAKTFYGIKENKRCLGVALKAQNYPNGINVENFDSELTSPTKPYYRYIKYVFSII